MWVERLTPELTAGDRLSLADLTRSFSSSAPELTSETLEQILTSDSYRMLAARQQGEIVGMLTLVIVRLPTILRGWVEDVIVAETARRQGIGAALMTAAIDEARAAGVQILDLTSRPSREPANALYRKLGFEQRETNVYRYDFRKG